MVDAVILAAGRGERMASFTNDKPKPLISIAGKTLIERSIEALKKAGVNKCIIVTGYKSETIRKHVGNGEKYDVKIRFVYNPFYENGNALSLYTAKKVLEDNEPFLVLMADHLIDPTLIKRALHQIRNEPLLCVDYFPKYPSQLKDATKVFVNQRGFVEDIGKEILQWNAVDTGVFILDNKIFEAIEQGGKKYPSTLSEHVKYMINNLAPLSACDVSGLFWLDIDLPEDVALAMEILKGMT